MVSQLGSDNPSLEEWFAKITKVRVISLIMCVMFSDLTNVAEKMFRWIEHSISL
jgi:hypothetical protein